MYLSIVSILLICLLLHVMSVDGWETAAIGAAASSRKSHTTQIYLTQHTNSERYGFQKDKGDRLTQRLVPIDDICNQSISPLMVKTSYFEQVHAPKHWNPNQDILIMHDIII